MLRFALVLSLAGCNLGEVELEPSTSPTSVPAATPTVPTNGVQVRVTGEPLAPGEEVELCRYIKADNEVAAKVQSIELIAAPGLHHSVVSKLPEKHAPDTVPCFAFPSEVMSGLSIPVPIFASSTQVNEETLELPPGVAIPLDAKQQLIVNYHYLNATNEVIIPEVFINLHFADPEVTTSEAGFYAFGNIEQIAVPPGGTQRITMACDFPVTAQLVTATPHMHQMGRYFELGRYDGDDERSVLFSSEDWFNPETLRFDPTIGMAFGDGLRVTCEWENNTDKTAYFGETTEDEMCFVFGFYYPAQFDVFGIDNFGCEVEENVITP